MACVRASFEQLAVRGEPGLAWDEAAGSPALAGGSYDSAIIRLTAKLDAGLLLLNRHVALEEFTVDIVVAREEEEEEEEGGGVLSFLQEHIVGSRKQANRYSKVRNRSEVALTSAWEACKAKGYHGLYAVAKVTPATLPDNPCRQRYTPGHYAEALLNGSRAYFMFQRHSALFEADALGLWLGGGGGCVAAVDVCYLVLAWRLNEQETRGITNPTFSLLNTTTTAAAAAVHQQQGRKRAAATQSAESSLTPARKRMRVSAKVPPPQRPPQPAITEEQQEEEEEEEEEEEVTVKNKRMHKDKIPEVWYSPDITAAKQQQTTPPRPAKQKASPPKPANQVHLSPASPANQPPSPSMPANKTATSPSRTANQLPSPQKLASQLLSPQKLAQEAEDDDLSDLTLGFERSTPGGRRKGRKSTTTPRKSMLLPQWSDEEREELLQFFDTLNPTQSEQTCIALTCKFATMRFGRDLPSKQLYQWVQRKDRTIHPHLDAYTLSGGKEGAHVAAAELFRSLNPEVSESKRVAFTCRFMQTQYGTEINSKELYSILSGAGKKRGGRTR